MKTIVLLVLACFTLAFPVCAHPDEATYTVNGKIVFGGILLQKIINLEDFRKCERSGWPITPFCEGAALGVARGISGYRKEIE